MIIWIIDLSGVQFGLKLYIWFKITWVCSPSSIWNHKYDFIPKWLLLHSTQFNYWILLIFNYEYYYNIIITITTLLHPFGNKSCKTGHTIIAFFAFHFPTYSLVACKQALKSDWLFCFSVPFSLAGEKMWFIAENSVICELIALARADQVAEITSDF